MALHSQLPLYKTVHELTQAVIVTKRNMPRDYKHTLGDRMVDELIAIAVLVFRANVARDKRQHLDEMLERKEVADFLLRLAVDLRCISTGQYAALVKLLDSVGKQTNGWRKKTATSPAA